MSLQTLFHNIYYARLNSSAARYLLRFLYKEGRAYTIPFGFLRGTRLRYDRSINYHAMLGLWELDRFALLLKVHRRAFLLGKDGVVCDVGANIGFYTLWFSKLLQGRGRIYAFEPVPSVLNKLKANVSLNLLQNVEVVPKACADKSGRAQMFVGHHHHVSSFLADWAGGTEGKPESISVETVSLDDFFLGNTPRACPDFIKMDIEGGGIWVLQGCDRCVEAKRPLILMESHTPREDLAICEFVLKHRYQAYRLRDGRWAESLDQPHPCPQGVWGELLLCPEERAASLRSLFRSP